MNVCLSWPCRKNSRGGGNIRFTRKRINTWWAGYSQVEYQKILLQEVADSSSTYDLVFFLTGLDYPLWSLTQLEAAFLSNPRKEYISAMDVSDIMKHKFTIYHFFRDSNIRNSFIRKALIAGTRAVMSVLPFRKPNYVMLDGKRCPIYMSSACMALTCDCAMYVLERLKQKAFADYFRYAYAPDELGIATIVMNSPYARNTVPYLHKEYRGTYGFAVTHEYEYKDICKILTIDDYERLIGSRKMFARKLTSAVSSDLIDKIDRHRNAGN